MAQHKSSKKRIRQTIKRRLENRFYAKTTRNAIRELRSEKKAAEAKKALPSVLSLIDKLAEPARATAAFGALGVGEVNCHTPVMRPML